LSSRDGGIKSVQELFQLRVDQSNRPGLLLDSHNATNQVSAGNDREIGISAASLAARACAIAFFSLDADHQSRRLSCAFERALISCAFE
jgi:hypothetical protein